MTDQRTDRRPRPTPLPFPRRFPRQHPRQHPHQHPHRQSALRLLGALVLAAGITTAIATSQLTGASEASMPGSTATSTTASTAAPVAGSAAGSRAAPAAGNGNGSGPVAADANQPLRDAMPSRSPVVGHEIAVRLDPERGSISGTDRLTLPPDQPQTLLLLHTGLQPRIVAGHAVLERIGRDGHLERYRLTNRSDGPVTIGYGGSIRHPLSAINEGMGRARMQSVGTIAADGVFLSGYTGWYPRVSGTLERFTLQVDLPPGWLAVSQGAGPAITDHGNRVQVTWHEPAPQDEIYLKAARFKLYRQAPSATDPAATAAANPDAPELQAWLRLPDDDLAERYLAVTADYLARYSALLGPYPYTKFALVENFWETGYGMPSFTLLGPRVLRLPFILHTSYPHEILHNWWGNGVFVDYGTGNWSEGLTTYLADHLNAELAGQGAAYRRDQLAAYADHVAASADFPLSEFRGRHGGASQAIGYGKAMMLFHMLRISHGDAAFIAALRGFYRDHLFQPAGYADLQRAFEQATGTDLDGFFAAWTGRTGAAQLALADVSQQQQSDGTWLVRATLLQQQPAAPFPLTVPLVIHAMTGPPQELRVTMDGSSRRAEVTAELPTAARRIAVDPRFDTFRTLLPGEAPVRLSRLFGATDGLILLPAAAPADLAAGYRALAETWVAGQPGWAIAEDREHARLPTDRPVWLLGWENRFIDQVTGPGRFTLDPDRRTVRLDDQDYTDLSPVLTTEHAIGPQPPSAATGAPATAAAAPLAALGWLAAATPAALPALARKLPHYGKQGYLVFDADGSTDLIKGQWPGGDSALMHWFEPPAPAGRGTGEAAGGAVGGLGPTLVIPAPPTLLETANGR